MAQKRYYLVQDWNGRLDLYDEYEDARIAFESSDAPGISITELIVKPKKKEEN